VIEPGGPFVVITAKAMLDGRRKQIHAERDRRLKAARRQRELAARSNRTPQVEAEPRISKLSGETEAGSAGTQPC
jgi:hypothetical protein